MMDRNLGLDLLRTAAILMVLFANCIFIFPVPNPIIAQFASLLGFFGLEIFFVLSGFLLSAAIFPVFMRDDYRIHTALRFIKKRFLKIAPLYFSVLLVNFGIAFCMNYPVDSGWTYFLFMQNFAWPIPNFFPESWGLTVIVLSFVIFPVALLMFAHIENPKRKSFAFLAIVFLLIALSVYAKWVYSVNTVHSDITQWDASLKTVLVYRIDSVFIGAAFGWFYRTNFVLWKRLRWPALVFGVFGVAFISIGVGFLRLNIEDYSLFWNVFYLPLASLSIAMLLPIMTNYKLSMVLRPVLFFTSISYALYLVHFSIVLQLMEHHFQIYLTTQKAFFAFMIVYLLVTFVTAFALTYFNRFLHEKIVSA